MADIFAGALPSWSVPHKDGTLGILKAVEVFYDDMPLEEAQRMEKMLVCFGGSPSRTPIKCDKAAWRVLPVTYLLAELDQAVPSLLQEMMISRIKNEGIDVRIVRIAAGHSLLISMPEQVVGSVMAVM
jgi:hypothetical protein